MNTRIVERSILHYTNKERRKRQLRRLQGHRALIRAARGHSQWMARSRRMSHTGQGGSQPWDRAVRSGYPSRQVSENIWQTSGRSGLAWKSKFMWRSDWKLGQAAVISWMNSPGHRANLLNPNWRCLGAGVANSRGRIYLTQKFGDRRGDTGKPHRSRRGSRRPSLVWLVLFLIIAVVVILLLVGQVWPGLFDNLIYWGGQLLRPLIRE